MNAQILGELVRARREAAGASFAIAAAELGVSVQFLFDLEAGKPSIQFDKAMQVAERVGLALVHKDDKPAGSMFARRVARRQQHAREQQLVEFHQKIAAAFKRASPSQRQHMASRAHQEIDRWESQKLCHPIYIEGWRAVLAEGAESALDRVIADPVGGTAMLQNTPFGFLKRRGALQ